MTAVLKNWPASNKDSVFSGVRLWNSVASHNKFSTKEDKSAMAGFNECNDVNKLFPNFIKIKACRWSGNG